MDLNQLRDILQAPYDRDTWKNLLVGVFPHVSLFQTPQSLEGAIPEFVDDYKQLGSVRLADGKHLAVFEVHVSDEIDLLRNRVGLRQMVAGHIDQATTQGVLCIFNSSLDQYRFTFVSRETVIDESGQIVAQETAPKRYTYVLGPGETRRTAIERFAELASRKESVGLEQVADAFSVERLNREFFGRYKEIYEAFVQHLMGTDAPTRVFGISRDADDPLYDDECKPLRDFVKKLLGRIVFLHFIQKKGWLGCDPRDESWKDGDSNFLRSFFEDAPDKDRFHSDRLVSLFFDALNKPERPNDVFHLTGTRIPYLNGGLFEEVLPEARVINFPASLFLGLLEFFSNYNFTIDENDPEENEIGIDPEMLGHIFENLLEENKDKGAYYTPKPVVQFMCKESILHYLENHLGVNNALSNLVRHRDAGDPEDRENWVRANAASIERLLDEVTVCDPAIGSGAFPIGILQEIFWLKLTLDWTLNDPDKLAGIKRRIIQNSIYGVDLDAGAVEIARLRCWLTIIVDEMEPQPLPNLDYKIMQGDSLFESFGGIDLSRVVTRYEPHTEHLGEQQELSISDSVRLMEFASSKLSTRVSELLSRYFGEYDPVNKEDIHREIDSVVRGHLDYCIEQRKNEVIAELSRQETEVKRKQNQLPSWRPTKTVERQINGLGKELSDLESTRSELVALDGNWERPYFLWHLYYQDVFEEGGFDIVIANPPYVRQEVIRRYKPNLKQHYECYSGTADLYVYFYERATQLLRSNGVLTFITSNKFHRSKYGRQLQDHLSQNYSIKRIVDFGDAPLFDAIAYASIFMAVKQIPDMNNQVSCYIWQKEDALVNVHQILQKSSWGLNQANFAVAPWLLDPPHLLDILARIRNQGTELARFVDGSIHYGIKTGLNNAFIINNGVYRELIAEHESATKIIHPIIRGKTDSSCWVPKPGNAYLILIESSANRDHPWTGMTLDDAEATFRKVYPSVYSWLMKFRTKLEKRSDQGKYFWELRSCDYWSQFTKPKVIIPTLAMQPECSVDHESLYSNDKTTICVTERPELLAGYLNSTPIWWALTKDAAMRQNGYSEIKDMYLRPLRIPDLDISSVSELEALSKKVVEDVLSGRSASQADLDLIDAIVARGFGLTSEELEIIKFDLGRP